MFKDETAEEHARQIEALTARLVAAEKLVALLEWGSCDGCGTGCNYCPLCHAPRVIYVYDPRYREAPRARFARPGPEPPYRSCPPVRLAP